MRPFNTNHIVYMMPIVSQIYVDIEKPIFVMYQQDDRFDVLPLRNSPTTMPHKIKRKCPRSMSTTASTLVLCLKSKSPLSMHLLSLSISLPISMIFMIASLRMLRQLRILKHAITTLNIKDSSSNLVIWFGSMLRISPPLVLPRSWIGNA